MLLFLTLYFLDKRLLKTKLRQQFLHMFSLNFFYLALVFRQDILGHQTSS